MEIVCCVLVLSLQLALSQYVQSPCPGIFDYSSDGANVYGVIQLTPTSPVPSLVIRTNFTVAAQLHSNYVGRIEAEDSNQLLQKYNSGIPVSYRVHFPVTSPLPRLTALTVNGNTICYGPADVPRPGQYITTLSLQHTSFLRGGGSSVVPIDSYNTIPQRRPDTVLYGNTDDLQSQVFTLNNVEINQPWSNNTPVYNQSPGPVYDQSTRPYYEQTTEIYDRTPSRPFNERPLTTRRPISTQRPVFQTRPQPVYEPPSRRPATTSRPVDTSIYYPEETDYQRPTAAPTSRPSSNVDCGVVSGGNENLPLIYNGQSYTRGDIPWLVAIYKGKRGKLDFICGGTLVSDRHIVTAAHCMQRRSELTPIREFVIKVGVHDLNDWSNDITVTRNVVSAAIHESYNASSLDNDLLVLTFDRRVEFNNYIRPVCLWSGNTDLNFVVGASGVVAGWGDQGDQDLIGQGVPHMVHLPIVSNAKCRASKTDFHYITSSKTLCAGDRNGAGPCRGDSGGGLYLLDSGRWRLRGVVSRSLRQSNGENVCNLNEYIVFTDTAQYIDWIKKIISKVYYD